MGGGHGRLTRLYGLGVDALVSINLILANGTKITTSETLYPELFRALRGSGGHSYGVATSLTFKLYNDPGPVNVFNGFYLASETVANAFQTWMKAAPNNANAYYITGYDGASKTNFVQIAAMCFGEATACGTVLAPLAAIPGCGTAACKVENPYTSYNNFLADNWDKKDNGGNAIYMVSGAIDLNTAGQMATITAFQSSFKQEDWATAATTCFVNSVLGGVSSTMDTNVTLTAVASAMRQSIGAVTCGVGWKGSQSYPDLIKKMENWGDTILRPMSTNQWVYWGEPQHNFVNNDWMNRYWGGSANYARLRAVKQLYDPNHVMTCYHCVGWEDITNVDPASCPSGCSCSNANATGVCMRVVSAANSFSIPFALYGLLLILYFFN
jgi:hypothetical protein